MSRAAAVLPQSSPHADEANELVRLRLEVVALREALGLQAAVEALPESFDGARRWLHVLVRRPRPRRGHGTPLRGGPAARPAGGPHRPGAAWSGRDPLLLSEVEGVARVERGALHPVRPGAAGADWALGFLQQAELPLLVVSLEKLLRPLDALDLPAAEDGR